MPKAKEIQTPINAWDVYSYWSRGTTGRTGRDNLRGFSGEPMMPVTIIPHIEFASAPASPTPSPTPTQRPPASETPTATATPTATETPTATATPQSSSSGPTTSGDGLPWAVLIVVGVVLAVVGAALLRGRGGTTGGTTGGGTPSGEPGGSPAGGPAIAVGVPLVSPCPPLIAAAKAAKVACEAARSAAVTAADLARTRAAEAEAARRDLDGARRAREAAEKELARRQKPPDRGGSSASSSFGGRDVHEDSYDLHLLREARAAANDAWEAAKAAATTEAERKAADDAWQDELRRLDGPDGIDEIRRRDKEGRAKWVREAEDALKTAQEAETSAKAALDRAVEASDAAAAAATAAGQHADEACARADAANKAAIDAGCLTADGRVPQPPVTPSPPPTPPTSPPEPPTSPPEEPTPPTPPTHERPHDCPDGAAPRVTERNPIDVDLFIISESQLKIDSNYPYGDNVDDALDNLDSTLKGVSAVMSLPGAVTNPVGSLLGTAGLPGFDSVTTKPAEAAAKSLRKLRERMEKFRRTGTWSLSVPFQHYRFFCRITEECQGGQWVVTKRELIGERVGKPTWHHSPPYEVQDVAFDSGHAWRAMTANYVRRNAQAERQIAQAATACAG